MASQLFRNLDRLAGVTGQTFVGERARRDTLTERHLGRSQQSYMQGQRLDTQRQLQRDRMGQNENQFKRTLAERKRANESQETYLKGQQGLAKDKLDELVKKNRFDAKEAEKDHVRDTLTSYDRGTSNLIAQQRVIAQQADPIEGLNPEQKAQLQQLEEQIRSTQLDKRLFMEQNIPPIQLREMNNARQELTNARNRMQRKKLDEYNFWNDSGIRYQHPLKTSVGNATIKHNSTGTEADKKLNIDDYLDQ